MTKVKNMFTETLILCAADLISNGKISDGTSQPSGPHDHAKADTYMHMKSTTTIAYHSGRFVTFPLTPNFTPMQIATTTYTTIL